MSNIRVLYLHAIECGPGTLKHKYLDCSFDVYCPQLRSGEWIRFIRVLAGVFLGLLVGACCFLWVCWYFFREQVAILWPIGGSFVFIIVFCLSFWLLMRFLLRRCLSEAVAIAHDAYTEWEPDIIVGQSFGAVCACHMDVPETPLLLLAPANQLFHNWAGIFDEPSIAKYPFVTVVHGELDQICPIEHSLALSETSSKDKKDLEIIPADDHRLLSIRELELRDYVHATVQKVDPELAAACSQYNPPSAPLARSKHRSPWHPGTPMSSLSPSTFSLRSSPTASPPPVRRHLGSAIETDSFDADYKLRPRSSPQAPTGNRSNCSPYPTPPNSSLSSDFQATALPGAVHQQ